MSVPHSSLEIIPFLDRRNLGTRALTTTTFYDGKWHMWIATPEGFHFLLGEPVESAYLGKTREGESDIHLDFLDLVAQRASWPDILPPTGGIISDILNLGTSLTKINHFHRLSGSTIHSAARRFVATEVEYIFMVCRSIYDLLQTIIARLWQRIEIKSKSTTKRNLPDSFRRMVMKGQVRLDPSQIADRWEIPIELARYYHNQSSFFEILRKYRDQAAHHGKDLEFPFVTKRGFAVLADAEPFASFGVWNEEHMLPNGLASLRPVLAHIITETVKACEEFSETIQSLITFPPKLAPDFTLYLRGYHTSELLAMPTILQNCLWWDQDP